MKNPINKSGNRIEDRIIVPVLVDDTKIAQGIIVRNFHDDLNQKPTTLKCINREIQFI